jgi:hypothetical protein
VAYSIEEIQPLVEQILAIISARIDTGQLVIHFHNGTVQRCVATAWHDPEPPTRPKHPLDTKG